MIRFVLFLVLFQSVFSKNNVLLVIVDDLRPALGVYNDPNAYTPNFDEFAKNSFIFKNAYAQVLGFCFLLYAVNIYLKAPKEDSFSILYYWFIAASLFEILKGGILLHGIRNQSLCAPSRNSFLLSRRPDSLHLYDFNSYWRDSVGNFTTLPQHFKENGYYTYSIGKIFHPGQSSNFTDDAKYSWSKQPFHPKTEIYKNSKVCLNPDGSLASNLLCPVIPNGQPGGTLPDLESLEAAIEFLDSQTNITNGKPFFLAVGFHKPHIPFKFPIDFYKYHPLGEVVLPVNRWRPSLMPTVAWNSWLDVKSRDDIKRLNLSFPWGVMPEDFTKEIIRNYNSAVSYIDDLFGSLLKKINRKNTIVVVSSDHGWARGEHGEFAKFSNFDVATRVPLMIQIPGLNNFQTELEDLVELVDLFPTLVDLTQVSSRLEICLRNGTNSKLCTEGKSLVPLMVSRYQNQSFIGKSAVFSQYPRPGIYPTQNPNSDRPTLKNIKIMGYSIRTQRYRYTEWIKFNSTIFLPDWSTVYAKELYDHLIDPEENLNLATRPELNYIKNFLRRKLILGWRWA